MTNDKTTPPLSKFGDKCLENGALMVQFEGLMQDLYDPESNTSGLINMAVAENTLMGEELREYFEKVFKLRHLDFTYGDGMRGTKRLSSALTSYINSSFHPSTPVTTEHMILAAGVTAILRQISQAIANPGDGILITAPYYPGFDNDFGIGHDIKPIAVSMPFEDVATMKEIEHLERTWEETSKAGIAVKAVVLCNPQNPLGRCYPSEVIKAYAQFAEKHNIHLISDEIYAKSVFSSSDIPSPPPFISFLSLDLEKLGVNPARAHVLYGMSKDFNSNGFRAGALISQHNTSLIESLITTAAFTTVASPTDALWSNLLNDEEFREGFHQENQKRLREAYEYVTAWLKFHNVPYLPSQAGHFLFISLRSIVSDPDSDVKQAPRFTEMGIDEKDSMEERSQKLWQYMLGKKVMLMPGFEMCHAPEPGWFRLTFAVRRDFVEVALKRLEVMFGWESWDGLKERKELEVVEAKDVKAKERGWSCVVQ